MDKAKGPIYVIGPMRGKPDYNYPAFRAAADILRRLDYEVINPAEEFDGDQGRTDQEYMRRAHENVGRAAAIVAMDGWAQSEGAVFEATAAVRLGLSLYIIHDDCVGDGYGVPRLVEIPRTDVIHAIQSYYRKSPACRWHGSPESHRNPEATESAAPPRDEEWIQHVVSTASPPYLIHGVSKEAPVSSNKAGGLQSSTPYRLDLLPPKAVLHVSAVLAEGASKYARNNWKKIETWSNVNHALQHVMAYMAGDDQDDHLGHAACRLLMALELHLEGQTFEGSYGEKAA